MAFPFCSVWSPCSRFWRFGQDRCKANSFRPPCSSRPTFARCSFRLVSGGRLAGRVSRRESSSRTSAGPRWAGLSHGCRTWPARVQGRLVGWFAGSGGDSIEPGSSLYLRLPFYVCLVLITCLSLQLGHKLPLLVPWSVAGVSGLLTGGCPPAVARFV